MAKDSKSDNSDPPVASSGTTGFFQQNPIVANSFYEDEGYKRVFSCKSFLLSPSPLPQAWGLWLT